MSLAPRHLIGVDGGGTGTRVRLCNAAGRTLGEGHAGPSALGQGAAGAWQQITLAVETAMLAARLGGQTLVPPELTPGFRMRTAIGLGLSGAENPAWVREFLALAPDWAALRLLSDGETALLGAHAGHPGALVSVGTGCVGTAHHPDGQRTVIGGWGWQLGDEAGGAWLGRGAMRHTQHAIDGRERSGPLAHAVSQRCGTHRHALLDWCASAGQVQFAELAPLVFELEASDPAAAQLIGLALWEVARLIAVLDPGGELPLVMAGTIGRRLQGRLPLGVQARCVDALGDACDGALLLLQRPALSLHAVRAQPQEPAQP